MKNHSEIIRNLRNLIINEDVEWIARDTTPFTGADVTISPNEITPDAFINVAPIVLVTKYYKEVSWLFEQLKETYSDILNVSNKYYFYGELTKVAIQYSSHCKGVKGMLLCILTEAIIIGNEILMDTWPDNVKKQ